MRSLMLALLLAAPTAALADEKPAIDAAAAWLALTDANDGATSHKSAAPHFRDAVPAEKWQEMLNAVRKPLGKLVSRTLKSAERKASLPGAPDGTYVVIQYETVFEKKKSATETVTPMLDKDGTWRVSGYFIR